MNALLTPTAVRLLLPIILMVIIYLAGNIISKIRGSNKSISLKEANNMVNKNVSWKTALIIFMSVIAIILIPTLLEL